MTLVMLMVIRTITLEDGRAYFILLRTVTKAILLPQVTAMGTIHITTYVRRHTYMQAWMHACIHTHKYM